MHYFLPLNALFNLRIPLRAFFVSFSRTRKPSIVAKPLPLNPESGISSSVPDGAITLPWLPHLLLISLNNFDTFFFDVFYLVGEVVVVIIIIMLIFVAAAAVVTAASASAAVVVVVVAVTVTVTVTVALI